MNTEIPDTLLQPVTIDGLRFKNRMIHVPTTLNMSDPLGHVTDKMVGAYESIAAGGSAATIVGATCVRHDGLINERMLGIYDDTYVIGLRDLTEVIRHNSSLSGIQLFYGGLIPGLGATTPLAAAQGWIPGTVSWGPSDKVALGNPSPLVIPTEVYDALVEDFAQGARRAREAGFDFVSYHFCHGSLPHANLSLLSNIGRTDEYADHFRFCEKIIERTQQLCGKEFPLIPRMCCDENLEGGFDTEYFAEHFAPRLAALGISALDCTFGSMFPGKSKSADVQSVEYIGPGFYTPHAVNVDNVRRLRQALESRGIDLPLIGSANLGTPEHLRKMVDDGAATFAGVCRLSIDDPDYARKIAEGREREIRKSTRTGASLLQGNIFQKAWAGSAQNPAFGRDRAYRLVPTTRPRKVVVVGGGSGGMEYAITARQIGHDVILLEKSRRLGGAMDWAGNYQYVSNMEMLRYQPDYHRTQMEIWDVPYKLGIEATKDVMLAEKPDVIVLATGAQTALPEAHGMTQAMDRGFAVTIETALSRDDVFDPGPKPVIIGAGIGGELAIDYARQGRDVRLLDENDRFQPVNYLGSRGPRVAQLLTTSGVVMDFGVRLDLIGEGMISVTKDGERLELACSSVILCPGRLPNDSLAHELLGSGAEVQIIGDARAPRSYGNAIHEAAYLVRRL